MFWFVVKFYEVIILNEMYGVYGRIKILVLDWKGKKNFSWGIYIIIEDNYYLYWDKMLINV